MVAKLTQKMEYSAIAPVSQETHRPFWSVMIPTYNCANYLVQTLESVLAQDPGLEHMQIEVVDDCSTQDDPEAVVREIGKGRVSFYRQPQNVGPTHNFNTCIRRSAGHYVHILHGDDYVAPNFYQMFETIAKSNPVLGFISCRTFVVDQKSEIDYLSTRLFELEYPTKNLTASLLSCNQFFTPSVVVSRSVYEKVGGFCESLRHCADWEMWIRAINSSSSMFINHPLAYYRSFDSNDTSKLAKEAGNVHEVFLLRDIFLSNYEEFDPRAFNNYFGSTAYGQAIKFLLQKDDEAAKKNALFWRQLSTREEKLISILKAILRRDFLGLRLMLNLI